MRPAKSASQAGQDKVRIRLAGRRSWLDFGNACVLASGPTEGLAPLLRAFALDGLAAVFAAVEAGGWLHFGFRSIIPTFCAAELGCSAKWAFPSISSVSRRARCQSRSMSSSVHLPLDRLAVSRYTTAHRMSPTPRSLAMAIQSHLILASHHGARFPVTSRKPNKARQRQPLPSI